MSTKNYVNVPPAPAIPLNISSFDDENVKEYDPGRLDKHPLFRFQPTHLVTVKKEEYSTKEIDEIIEWWRNLKIEARDNPFIRDGNGNVVIIWTFCGGDDADPDNGIYGDDCE